MMQKHEILLNLLKNGWAVRSTWICNGNTLVLKIEVGPSSYRSERVYIAEHKMDLEHLPYIKDKDYAFDCIELGLLNQLYQTVLNEQGTKVL